jgi:RNA polymerase sigma-70 factor (ECF subfamily)
VHDSNQERFELLYRQHFRAVLRYALARLEPERAKDVTAETFLIAWRRLGDVPSEPAAWLFGVARKVIASQLRADNRRDALTARLAVARFRDDGPADPADQVAQRDSALAALARLGESDREVLKLIAWDGLSARMAAEVLGISQLNFAVRLHRARRRLAAELTALDAATRRRPRRGMPVSQRTAVPQMPVQTPERHADVRSHQA